MIEEISLESGPLEWAVMGITVKNHTEVEGARKKMRRRLSAKYLEKWVTIRYRLTGYGPGNPFLYESLSGNKACNLAGPSVGLTTFIKRLFKAVEIPFEYYRHSPECTKPGRYCHKHFGCRHNLPHYNTMMRYFLFFAFMKGYRTALHHLYLFPPLRTLSKLKKHEEMMKIFWRFNGWYPFIRIFPELNNYKKKCNSKTNT